MKKQQLDSGQIRQGDVLLVASTQTSGEPEQPAAGGSVVLAHGEVTGHRHRFERAMDAQVFAGGAVRNLLVNVPAALKHEEHAHPTVPPAIYDLPRQVEWADDLEPRQVAD